MSRRHHVLLAIADEPADGQGTGNVLAALRASRGRLGEAGLRLAVHSYAEVLAGIPDPPREALCLMHFPYQYWDGEIEGKVPDLYGTGQYGSLLREHLLAAGAALRHAVPDGLAYVNSPPAIALTRDKIALKERLTAAGVPTPRAFAVSSPADITRLLAEGRQLYVKAAHASMNKGITVLSERRWRTNYGFDGQRLGPGIPAAGSWRFRDIAAGDQAFLSALCATRGFLVEEDATACADDGHGERHELRVTVVRGTILAAQSRSAPSTAATTAPAEGGTPGLDVGDLPPAIADAALSATRAAGLQYAVHDIVLDRARRPFVVDVQAFPALGTSPRLLGDLLASFASAESPSVTAR